MRNVFVSLNNGEDVMVFCADGFELDDKTVEKWARYAKLPVNEVYGVKDEEVQYYCYEPVWVMDERKYNAVLEIASKM